VLWEDRDGRAAFYCAAGCEWRDVAEAIEARGHGVIVGPSPGPSHDDRADRTAALAREIWLEARPARGTLAERYLARRRLELPAELDCRLVRFHPRCPCGPDRRPAMVIGLREVDSDEIAGISRTFLTAAGTRDGQKMVLGRMAIAKLSPAPGARLNVCEGFETGLAQYLRGHRPLWSLGSAGKLERLAPIAGVDELIVWLDNDASRTGERSGYALYWRWRDANRQVVLHTPGRV